jgi:excisionase family DNA binding protein
MASAADTRPTFATVDEVSREIGYEIATIRGWVRDGVLPAYQPGRKILIRWSDLDAFIESKRVRKCA